MTAASRPVPRYLKQRFKLWQKRAILDGWDIEVRMGNLRADEARTEATPHGKRANVVFNADGYDEWSFDYLDILICHELYHILSSHRDIVLNDHIGDGKVNTAYAKADEDTADAFAMLLVRAYKRKRS